MNYKARPMTTPQDPGRRRKEKARRSKQLAAWREKKAAESQLADPALFADPARSTPLVTAYREASKKLDELYARWEHKNEELAAAEAQLA